MRAFMSVRSRSLTLFSYNSKFWLQREFLSLLSLCSFFTWSFTQSLLRKWKSGIDSGKAWLLRSYSFLADTGAPPTVQLSKSVQPYTLWLAESIWGFYIYHKLESHILWGRFPPLLWRVSHLFSLWDATLPSSALKTRLLTNLTFGHIFAKYSAKTCTLWVLVIPRLEMWCIPFLMVKYQCVSEGRAVFSGMYLHSSMSWWE